MANQEARIAVLDLDGQALFTWDLFGEEKSREITGMYGVPLVGPTWDEGEVWEIDGLHGAEEDRANEVVHFGARHTLFRDGMWMQPEPLLIRGAEALGEMVETPAQLSAGVYALGNPIVLHDRSGEAALAVTGGTSLVLSGGGTSLVVTAGATAGAVTGYTQMVAVTGFNPVQKWTDVGTTAINWLVTGGDASSTALSTSLVAEPASKGGARTFTNLFPEDAPAPLARSKLLQREGKWLEIRPDGTERSASGRYIFAQVDGELYGVRGTTRVGGGTRPAGHIDLAQGSPVEYAGEIQFSGRHDRGIIRYWNNQSGHFQPDPGAASQANLPQELFQPYIHQR